MTRTSFAVQFGKVRINTAINAQQRILTATHRISAFDSVLPFEVEDKGQILQAISVFFFANTRDIIPNHFLGCLDPQTMLVKSGRVLPLEIIARGTLTGSLWKSYSRGGPAEVSAHWGIELPAGLEQHHLFSEPLITFTTKAAHGHDELVTPRQATAHVVEWLKQNRTVSDSQAADFAHNLMQQVSGSAVKLFRFGQKISAEAGLLLMDTKYEFALDENNTLMLVDEIHTPDASRFVDLAAFENGTIDHLSKEWLRDKVNTAVSQIPKAEAAVEQQKPFVMRSFWNKDQFRTQLSTGIKERYQKLFERLFPGMRPWDVVAPHLVPWPVDPASMRKAEAQQRLPSRVLVVGSGGRDYSLATLLERQPEVDVVYTWPGRDSWNEGKKLSLGRMTATELVEYCQKEDVGWAVFGPEMPIAQGLAEQLRTVGVHCLAPNLDGARLEVSKIHTKNVLTKAQCPTAESWTIGWEELKQITQHNTPSALASVLSQYPYVLKYESLAAGKGVCLIFNDADRADAIKHFESNLPSWLAELNSLPVSTFTHEKNEPQFLIEKLLPGKEISAIALCHGEDYVLLPFAQDFKRRNNQQTGPNTGGMGAVCPVPLSEGLENQIHSIFKKTLKALKELGTDYRGFLFAGLMLDEQNKAHVLEYNCRLGDPETQVILPGLGRDFVLAMWLTSKNESWKAHPWFQHTPPHHLTHDGLKRCFVVLASPEYPEGNAPPRTLLLPEQWPSNTEWIPSGVDAGGTTKAGRIAGVLATAASEELAVATAYASVKLVNFAPSDNANIHYRTDVGFPGFVD